MAVTVAIDLGYEFTVKASLKDVFDIISDVPTSVAFFPKVDKLVDLGVAFTAGRWKRWAPRRSTSRPSMPANTCPIARRAQSSGRQ